MLASSDTSRRFDPEDEVLPGVRFGLSGWAGSPAYWSKMAEFEADDPEDYISPKGTPLAEDLAFCLLGGYGVKMELNRAAWEHLHEAGVFSADPVPSREEIEVLLSMPLLVEGRRHKYRYPRQRADRLHVALDAIRKKPPETDDPLIFRRQLMELPGIGPKTASWIVRNWLGSDEVAILDIHVLRAGELMGLFPEKYRLPKDYEALEKKFLEFAQAIQVRASLLDAIMWRDMRILFG